MVTIKDVAVRAGVSVTTVSRVMNNRGPLSENTKTAVKRAMEELGYMPNDVARALGKNSLNIIGLIVPSIQHPFFAELVHAFEYDSYTRGYKLMVSASDYNYKKEKHSVGLLRRTMVDGIIYASHSMGSDFLEDMKVPAVTLENVFAGLPAILSDNAQGGFLAARHLLARGCRNLVTISGQRNLHLSADERTVSFIRECERQGASCKVYSADEEMLKTMEYSRIVSQVFNENPNMDGIFASSDIIGAQCIQMAFSLGYKILDEIKIVGYDDVILSRLVYPPLTSIRQNIPDLVKATMDTLVALIAGEKVPETQTIPVTFIERRTT